MFGLPVSTELKKPLHKTLIYDRLATEFTANRKKEFEQDVSRIYVVHELSPASLNVNEGETVSAIFAVLIELKKKDYNERNVSTIAKVFGQNLLIILHYADKYQLAMYQKKVLHSDWITEDAITLEVTGSDLNTIWENLVRQVSGIFPDEIHTLDEQIDIEDEKDKLRKQIAKLEAKAKREPQSKKKYEIHKEIKTLEKKLEEP